MKFLVSKMPVWGSEAKLHNGYVPQGLCNSVIIAEMRNGIRINSMHDEDEMYRVKGPNEPMSITLIWFVVRVTVTIGRQSESQASPPNNDCHQHLERLMNINALTRHFCARESSFPRL